MNNNAWPTDEQGRRIVTLGHEKTASLLCRDLVQAGRVFTCERVGGGWRFTVQP